MLDIHRVTDGFAVAPQVAPEDFAEVARAGFMYVINNRPDGEAPDQPTSAEAERAARAAGLIYVHAPFAGRPPAEAIDALDRALAGTQGPILAYCRSGTRCISTWAMQQARSRSLDVDAILAAARSAGYDLDGLKDFLRNLSSGY